MTTKNDIYKYFAQFIFEKTGIVYSDEDHYRLDTRFNDLIRKYQLKDINEFYDSFVNNKIPGIRDELIDKSTNNETFFFRDTKPFKALVNFVIPELMDRLGSAGKIKLWSAACSTGQEVYSIILSILEANPSFPLERLDIRATDISRRALEQARNGTYDMLEIQRGLPIQLVVKYFDQIENGIYQVKPKFRAPITFSEFNLLTDNFTPDSHHIVFCRNVLIYQNPENRKAIIHNLFKSIMPDGFLFMGAGEGLFGTGLEHEQIQQDGAMIYRRTTPNKSAKAV